MTKSYTNISAAVGNVAAALAGNPVLGLFLLNAVGIAAATWFLDRHVTNNDERLDLILKSCLPH